MTRMSLTLLGLFAVVATAAMALPPADREWRERYRTQEEAFQAARRDPSLMDATLDSLTSFADRLAATGDVTPTLRDSLLALVHDRAGIFAFRLSRLDDAALHFDEGVVRARASGVPALLARLLNSKAVGHAARGDVENAVQVWRELLPLREEVGDSNGVAVTWSNLAGGYRHLGRLPDAIDASERALVLQHAIHDSSGIAASYSRLSELFSSFLRHRESLAFADSAVTVSRAARLHTSHGVALIRRAEARLEMGQTDSCLADVDRAIEVHERTQDRFYADWARLVQLILLVETGQASAALPLVPDLARSALAGTSPEFATRLDVAHAAALVHTNRLDEADEMLTIAIDRFEAHRDRLEEEESRIGAFDVGGELYATKAALELARGRPREAWLAADAGQAAVLRAAIGGEETSADAVLRVLVEADAVLVQYLTSHLHPAVAFVVTPDTVRSVVLGDRRAIDRDAGRVAELLAAGESASVTASALTHLSAAVLHPVLSVIPETSRLYLVPPVRMGGFPFELLPDPDGVPLGDRMAVAHLPAASVLPLLVGRAASGGGMLALADPHVNADAINGDATERGGMRSRFTGLRSVRSVSGTPLPYARKEVARVRVRDAEVRMGDAATREAATGEIARGAAVLHFATHAAVDPLHGDRSALLLAGPNGLFTAAEVETIPYHADLVTLSGCQTKGGYPILGEGTLGLTRAFLLAGSRSVVSSLWDVEDEAASRFMDLFYAGLRQGLPRDESLRQARRRLADEGVPPRDHAAFVLTGVGHEPVAAMAGATLHRGPVRLGVPATVVAIVMLFGIVTLVRRR